MSASVVPVKQMDDQAGSGSRFVCALPGGSAVHIELGMIERLEREAVQAFRAVTRRGSEIGGLLLGSASPGIVRIDDFELVECEFARGPLYVLSDGDHAALAGAVQRRARSVVGFFRSNTRKELATDEEDAMLAARHLQSGSVMLLVKPYVTKASQAAVYCWMNGALSAPVSMPFRRAELQTPAYAASILASSADPIDPRPEPAPVRETPVLRIVSRREEPAPEAVAEEIPAEPEPQAATLERVEPPPPTPRTSPPLPAPDPAIPDADVAAAIFASRARWNKSWLILGALAVALAGGGVYLFSSGDEQQPAPVSSSHISSSLGLRVERSAGQLVLTWNRDADAVKNARRAVLSIWDGKQAEKIELEANQFRGGSIVYAPLTSDVSFRLEIFGGSDADPFSEHVRVLGGKPSPLAPPPVEPLKAENTEEAPSEQASAEQEEEQEEEQPARPVRATKQFQSLVARIKSPASVLPEPPAIIGRPLEAPKAIEGASPALPAPAPPAAAAPAVSAPAPKAKVGGTVQEARLVKRREPAYPQLARQARVAGAVRLGAKITRDGRVTDLKTLSGHPLLRQAAMEAVSQWVYSPATLNGEPVDAETTIEITFSLGR